MKHSAERFRERAAYLVQQAQEPIYVTVGHFHRVVRAPGLEIEAQQIADARAELAEAYARRLDICAVATPCELGCNGYCAEASPRLHGITYLNGAWVRA